jgi:hypothetical protein
MIVAWRTTDRLMGRTTAELLTPLPKGLYGLRVELEGCQPAERPMRIDGKGEHSLTVHLQAE